MKPPIRSALSSWWRLVGFVRPWRGQVALATAAGVVAAAATAGWARLLGPLLESVLKGGAVTLAGVTFEPKELAVKLPLAVVGVAVLKALSTWLHSGLMSNVAQLALASLRRALYDRVLTLPPSWFEKRHSGELLSRFTADVAQVEFAVGTSLSAWVKDTLQTLALLAVCASIDGRLFLLTFLVIPGMILPVSRFAKSARKAATKGQASLGALTQLASEHLQALPIVQAYGREPQALAAFDAEQGRYLSVMKRSLFIRGAFTPTTELLGIIGVAIALVFGANAVAEEPQLAGHLVSFLAAALLMYQPVKSLSGNFSQVLVGLGAAERLFEILDAHVEPERGAQAGPLEALTLEDVRFSYGDGREALAAVSFSVKAGEHVALVGPSGAGKSTVVSLLLGFSAPAGGALRWNGVETSQLSRRSIRENLAWVPQEPVLLSGTVRENLWMAKEGAPDDALWTALEHAHAKAFVQALPNGLDTPIGERGATLSGGQRQRLAIARAFLKAPSLLLLDEPTSALDASTEQEVQAGLSELMEDRAVLVIAHRLATVRKADRIVVMEKGRVVEQGTWDALMAANGAFSRLVAHGLG
ncbi:MAG: ABC transporter ATP-binding protein [Myxococcales bacterium]|nr:ABC transporter ATP-binding protein [Myxococcales bacterium]